MGWEHLTGWWTPGWGSLFTVAVAVAAIAVGAFYNRRTLQRAERHFEQARHDARDDKLRAEISAFLLAVSERSAMDKIYRARLEEARHSEGLEHQPSPRYMQSLIEETVGTVHNRLAVHSFSIRMLTVESRITAPVHQIEQAVRQELDHLREVAGLGDKPVDPRVELRVRLQEMFSSHARSDLEAHIDSSARLLKKYCLEHLPLERH